VLRFASLGAPVLVLASFSAPVSAASFSGTWATVTDHNGHYQLTLLQGQGAVVSTFDETNPRYSGTSNGVAFTLAGTRTAKRLQAASNAEIVNRFAALDKQYQAMAVAAAKADPADWQKTAALHDELQTNLDSMGELGDTESLRLQMAMDRMSKMMTTLSNILKKVSDTAQSINQNIK
jgi:hypothetical protein